MSSRMLKKSASGVLASLRGSTYRMRFSEIGSSKGVFPFAKIHLQGRMAHTKCGLYLLASSLAAALYGKRRVSARQGWAGEKSGLFEQPAWSYAVVSDMRTIGFLGSQHRYAAVG
jgi:hypothetical protein